ncbi:MAG: hypothetical protein DIZ77_00410, partial [endosymbiont of Seepiophila jonesi]
MKNRPRVIVIGGGLGGLWTTLRIVEAGFSVELFSLFEVKRSHSVCAQGGINAVLDTKGQRDSVRQHLIDTVKGGSYLANQPPIQSMCEEAPGLIRTFERMGVTFSRTPEGLMDLRLFGGVKNKRTCFAGASTGQQLMYGVDEQVRRHEAQGSVHKREWWEFLSLVLDSNGHCKGIIAFNLHSLEVRAFRADAVVMATGGMGKVYGHRTTNSTNATGAAAFRCYLQGARFANAEFFQFHRKRPRIDTYQFTQYPVNTFSCPPTQENVMSGKAESEALASYWQQQIEAWQSSGQTQQAYCKANELSCHRFGYWRRKLRHQSPEAQSQKGSVFVPVL